MWYYLIDIFKKMVYLWVENVTEARDEVERPVRRLLQEFRLEIMVRFKGKPCRSREVDQLKIYFGHRTNRTFDELDMGDERQRN